MAQFRKSKTHTGKINVREMKQAAVPRPGPAAAPVRQGYLYLVLALILTFVAFIPSLNNDFIITWDDNAFITENTNITSLKWENIKTMFSEPVSSNYIPLVQLSWAMDYHFFKLAPMPYHLHNILLHLITAGLVFYILILLRINLLYAFFGALLFGINPMRVESVAWVTERKDLLYAVFYFASILSYIYFLKAKKKKGRYFILTLVCMVLALLAKIQAVSLPLIYLILDYYFERKLKFQLLLEKIPFFALSLFFGIIGIIFLGEAGALEMNENYTLAERTFFGLFSLLHYLIKFIYPFHLSANYPYPAQTGNPLPFIYYLSPFIIAGLAFLVFLTRKYTRAIVFGSLFFLFSIMFLLQIYAAGTGFRVDRYTYVPYFGLFFLLVWFGQYLSLKNVRLKPMIVAFLCLYSAVLAYGTWARSKVWHDSMSLWTDVIEKFPGRAALPYYQRGVYQMNNTKDNDGALADYSEALKLNPKYYQARINRGQVYFEKKEYELAMSDWKFAAQLKPNDPMVMNNLASVYRETGILDSAVYYFNRTLEIDSTVYKAIYFRGITYDKLGKYDLAIQDFRHYLVKHPESHVAFFRIGDAYRNSGRYNEALPWYDRAIGLNPGYGPYYLAKSYCYYNMKNMARAREEGLKARQFGAPMDEQYLSSLGIR